MPRRTKQKKSQPISASPTLPTIPARVALWYSLGVALALLLVYLRTLIPTAVDQDSGELIAAAHTLGIAHPTGYPLWTLLGKFFDLLPLGHTSAYRVALASAVPAAAAGGLLCWLVLIATGTVIPGIVAGLAFGLWYPTWSQAVLAEVYGLSGLLFSLFLIAVWKWSRKKDLRHLLWLALIGGAVSMHHRTALLAVAPALAMAFWYTPPYRSKKWLLGALVFLAPFLFYLYLPIRASMHPAVNWTNPVTFDRFYAHAMGTQYTHFALQNSFDVAMAQANRLFAEGLAGGFGAAPPGTPYASPDPVLLGSASTRLVLSTVLGLVGIPLILWGWWAWYKQQPREAVALALGSAIMFFWVIEWGEISDPKVFLLPFGAVLAVCGGWGLAQAQQQLLAARRYVIIGILGAIILAILFAANWSRSDRSYQWEHRDRWYAALAQMGKNAIFISMVDNPSFVTTYLQQVEGFRKDVTLLRTVGMMQPWYVELIADPELRKVANEQWQCVSQELGIRGSGTPEYRDGVALFAARLAQYYRGRRPVYTLYDLQALYDLRRRGLVDLHAFVGLSEDLALVSAKHPQQPAPLSVLPPASPTEAVGLLGLHVDRTDVGTGELVGFRAQWRAETAMQPAWFALQLIPVNMDPTHFQNIIAKQGRYQQSYPVLYGLPFQSLESAPAWEQRGDLMIPTNAPPGDYHLLLSYSPFPPQFQQWAPVGTLRVK